MTVRAPDRGDQVKRRPQYRLVLIKLSHVTAPHHALLPQSAIKSLHVNHNDNKQPQYNSIGRSSMATPNIHSTAATEVFSTPELLEMILLETIVTRLHPTLYARAYVDEHRRRLVELLRYQRVSKAFNATINNTPSLRRALFFADTDYTPVAGVSGNATLNPLVHERRYRRGLSGGTIFVEWTLHPLGSKPALSVQQSVTKRRRRILKEHHEAQSLVRGGSWQKMMLTSSPLQIMVHQISSALHGARELGAGAKVADALEGFVV
ncbi:hypothetical protein LTR56_012931 [Elasticomyces elasticus]|nr:hypothetical protein LTR56_012931 [Elasticomyces elasticus]KAK3667999.1 hypothetical protein LTR22_001066 [Elasticomyces elasticus]KAK4925060.1 hypothetical protein LTR49_007833 [Elasticomyces elasticus]KAK5767639.1 hypothetical protein LTS12_002140 [Elasticomyces elasticus]